MHVPSTKKMILSLAHVPPSLNIGQKYQLHFIIIITIYLKWCHCCCSWCACVCELSVCTCMCLNTWVKVREHLGEAGSLLLHVGSLIQSSPQASVPIC